MWKLESLRALMARCIPDLARDPERLIVMAGDGSVQATLANGLSFEYAYTAEINVLDFTSHADAIFVPLLAWIGVNQSDLLDNPDKRRGALQFKVDALNTHSMDIRIKIPLTERVIVKADPDHPTRYNCVHPPEPCHVGTACTAEHWELWVKEQKVGEWDIPAPEGRDRFGL